MCRCPGVLLGWIVLAWTVPVGAQPEIPEDPRELRALVRELVDQEQKLRDEVERGNEHGRPELEAAEAKTRALIDRFLAPGAHPSRNHYLGVVLSLTEAHAGWMAARVGDSRFVGALIAHRMAREMRARLQAK